MGSITSICSKQQQKRLLSRVSQLKNDGSQQNLMVKKLPFHQIADLFPYRYLGKGLFGTTVEVFVKQEKKVKFAEKIVPKYNLHEDYICYDKQIVDKIMLDPILKHKIVKVHAYSISNQRNKMYMIMDLMKKGDLYFHLCKLQKRNGRYFSQKVIKRIAFELLEVIQKFHSYKIIFRNLRAQNIFIKQNGKLAVSDFFFSINSPKCHTYFGAAQYAPPEIHALYKSSQSIIEGVGKNLTQISDCVNEQRQLRRSPDNRRYKMNTDLTTHSCDIRQDLLNLKHKKKQFQSYRQKLNQNQSPLINLKKIENNQNKEELQSPNFVMQRKNSRNLTTLNLQARPVHDKHPTFAIIEEKFRESQQKDQVKLGPGFKKMKEHQQSQQSDQIDQNCSNISQYERKSQYDMNVDFWMLGILLYELIFGKTPFQKFKNSSDAHSRSPQQSDMQINQMILKEIENELKVKQISAIWPQKQPNQINTIVSQDQRSFIQSLLAKQPQNRPKIKQLKEHAFLENVQAQLAVDQLIYEGISPQRCQKDIKYYMKNKDSSLIASRTIFQIKGSLSEQKLRVTERLFQHDDASVRDDE